jgi:hypothetical protein
MEVAVSMMWCQRAGSCQPIGTRDERQSCEGNYLRDADCRAFCQYLESQMERHEGCSLDVRKWKEKGQNQVKLREVLMQPGEKLNLTRSIRSAKTGSLLPKEGTLISVTENLGRTLLLVEFARGQHEYLFENEVEFEQDHSSSSNEECYL